MPTQEYNYTNGRLIFGSFSAVLSNKNFYIQRMLLARKGKGTKSMPHQLLRYDRSHQHKLREHRLPSTENCGYGHRIYIPVPQSATILKLGSMWQHQEFNFETNYQMLVLNSVMLLFKPMLRYISTDVMCFKQLLVSVTKKKPNKSINYLKHVTTAGII